MVTLVSEPITLQQDVEIALQVEKLAEIEFQQATAHILKDGKFRISAAEVLLLKQLIRLNSRYKMNSNEGEVGLL